MKVKNFCINYLGQSGIYFQSKFLNFMIDPYLSNSVEELDSIDLKRKISIPYPPNKIRNLDWLFITHEHIDHCDPYTIPELLKNNPNIKLMAPEKVRKIFIKWGISKNKIFKAKTKKFALNNDVYISATPAAHPKLTIGSDGEPNNIGWLLEINGKKILFAGDTSLTDEVLNNLRQHMPIECGFLPVNEDNYFRRRRGIVGNMSVREAFGLADELNIRKVFPVHWDMFDVNSTLLDEIMAIYNGYSWNFKLIFDCEKIL